MEKFLKTKMILLIFVFLCTTSILSAENNDESPFEININAGGTFLDLGGSVVCYLDKHFTMGEGKPTSFAFNIGIETSYFFSDYLFGSIEAKYTFPSENEYIYNFFSPEVFLMKYKMNEKYQSLLFNFTLSAKFNKSRDNYPFVGAGFVIGTAKYTYKGWFHIEGVDLDSSETIMPVGFLLKAGYKLKPFVLTASYTYTKADTDIQSSLLEDISANYLAVNIGFIIL